MRSGPEHLSEMVDAFIVCKCRNKCKSLNELFVDILNLWI